MVCAIWYVKNTYGEVVFLIKLQAPATFLKLALFHGCFSRFLNCANATKTCKASHFHHLRTRFHCEFQLI